MLSDNLRYFQGDNVLGWGGICPGGFCPGDNVRGDNVRFPPGPIPQMTGRSNCCECQLEPLLSAPSITRLDRSTTPIGHGLMGVLMHPHYLRSLVFSFTPGSVDLEKAC